MGNSVKRTVLAYSGGLDTSVIIQWLKETYSSEVVAFVADVGQGTEIKGLKEKAMKSGAKEIYIVDLKEEFVKDFVFPMLRAGAVYEGSYMLGTSIARPLIAKAQMEIARKVKADSVSHGATGKGNDQIRFELTYYAMDPHINVIAPWREWDLKGRSDLLRYAKKHNIDVPVTKKKPYSMDRNLFHLSFEGGILEDPWKAPKEDMFVMTLSPEKAPNRPTYIEVEYLAGDPVKINGKSMPPAALLEHLNKVGGKNGIGRIDIVESRYVGMKSRGVYETPGGTILHIGRQAVESLTMDRDLMHLRDGLMPRYAELIYNGYWYAPERRAMQAFIDESASAVTGTARLKLYKGNVTIVGRKAPTSLYRPDFATFEQDAVYDQKDANGFIKVNALRLKIDAMLGKSKL